MEATCEVMNPQMNSAVSNSAVMIGPVVINHPRGKRLLINAADIPISYADFQTFFFETVVRKQLASYPLKQFIKDVLEKISKEDSNLQNVLRKEESKKSNKHKCQQCCNYKISCRSNRSLRRI